jgi:hypothetical protein
MSNEIECISLCNCCRNENIYDNNWYCDDEDINVMSFRGERIFYNGIYLCESGKNPDCIYKYARNKIIAIEIKNQPIRNINRENLAGKIKNTYNCAYNNGLILVAFILQVSSGKNQSIDDYKFRLSFEEALNVYNIKMDKNGILRIKDQTVQNIKMKFDLIKCTDFDSQHFNCILT